MAVAERSLPPTRALPDRRPHAPPPGGDAPPQRPLSRFVAIPPPVQAFSGQVQREGARVAYDPYVDPHIRSVNVAVRPAAAFLPEPVRHSGLRLLRGVAGVGYPRVANGCIYGDGFPDREDLRPRDRLHPPVALLRRGGGDCGT